MLAIACKKPGAATPGFLFWLTAIISTCRAIYRYSDTMPAMTDTIKVEIAVAILSLLSAGENRSFFIMPEIYNGVNNYGYAFVCGIMRFSFYYLIHLHSFDGAKERSKKTPAARRIS